MSRPNTNLGNSVHVTLSGKFRDKLDRLFQKYKESHLCLEATPTQAGFLRLLLSRGVPQLEEELERD